MIGVIAALAAWGFLELVHQIQVGVFEDLPDALGYDTAPVWWPLPMAGLAGLIVAYAIVRLPGGGGHLSGRRPQYLTTVALSARRAADAPQPPAKTGAA